jgi:Proline racemase
LVDKRVGLGYEFDCVHGSAEAFIARHPVWARTSLVPALHGRWLSRHKAEWPGHSTLAGPGDGLPGRVGARDAEVLGQPLEEGLSSHQVDGDLLLLAPLGLGSRSHLAVVGQHDDHLALGDFGEGQIDRNPTGSGVTARLAVDAARGLARAGEARLFAGPTGVPFTGEVIGEVRLGDVAAVRLRVGGSAFYCGESSFTVEADDDLRDGFGIT